MRPTPGTVTEDASDAPIAERGPEASRPTESRSERQQIVDAFTQHALFDVIDDARLVQLAGESRIRTLEADTVVFREGDRAEHLYLILEGEVAVEKQSERGGVHEVARLRPGAAFGELVLLGAAERSATCRTTALSRMVEVPVEAMQSLHSAGLTQMIVQVGGTVADRLQSSTALTAESLERALEESRMRVHTGYFLVAIMAVFTAFTTLLGALSELERQLGRAEFVTVPLLAAVTAVVVVFVKKTGLPPSFFGLRRGDLARQLRDALLTAVPVLILIVVLKQQLLNRGIFPPDEPLLRLVSAPGMISPLMILAYVVFVPFQELICRGTVQGSMNHFVVSRFRVPIAILMSNGIFFVTHLKSSLALAVAAAICGFGWGWMYHRHRSLIGVSVSHTLIGVWAFELVGMPGVLD